MKGEEFDALGGLIAINLIKNPILSLFWGNSFCKLFLYRGKLFAYGCCEEMNRDLVYYSEYVLIQMYMIK